MAKTGINFERANVASAEKHNKRDKGYIKAVNESPNKKYDIFNDRSGMNVFWENPKYAGKTLPKLLDEMRSIYREHVGQSPQEDDRVRQITDKKTGMKKEVVTPGWAPIREGVCPIKEDTTIDDFKPFCEWLESKGPKVIGIYLHRDEGHTDLVTGERKYNYHGHVVVDWLDHETGKTYKLSKIDASEMQTQLALSLGMERGESKVKTGADHLTPDEYRAKAVAEEIIKLTTLRTEVTDGLRESCTALQEIGKDTVRSFDDIIKAAAVEPTKDETANRNRLEEEASEKIEDLKLDELKKKSTTLRTLIMANTSAIDRIGAWLRKLAAKIPDKKFHLFSSSTQKAQILAIEAEKESEIGNVRAEAERRVNEAETAKNEAIRQAQAAETESKKRRTAFLTQEQAAREEKKKYEDLNAGLEQKITEAKEAGKNEGINIQHRKWMKWKETNHDPLVTERDELNSQVSTLKTKLADKEQELSDTKTQLQESKDDHTAQAVETAKALIRKWGAAPFEKAELDYNITEFGSWQTAKKEIAREQQQNKQGGGVKMH